MKKFSPLVLLLVLLPLLTARSQDMLEANCRQEVSSFLQATENVSLAVRIDSLWGHFEGRPYLGGTLTPPDEEEKLILRLDGFDCVTWIDNAMALLFAENWDEYRNTLILNRYYDSKISFVSRSHFFTDWLERSEWEVPEFAQVVESRKVLNFRTDSTRLVEGQPLVVRDIRWLPVDSLRGCSHLLKNGDLVGFYTEIAGLDVSHVGMLQIESGTPWLLHASSVEGQVVRVEFLDYASKYAGVIIIRQKSYFE